VSSLVVAPTSKIPHAQHCEVASRLATEGTKCCELAEATACNSRKPVTKCCEFLNRSFSNTDAAPAQLENAEGHGGREARRGDPPEKTPPAPSMAEPLRASQRQNAWRESAIPWKASRALSRQRASGVNATRFNDPAGEAIQVATKTRKRKDAHAGNGRL
jgi:hypothetical protein